MLIGDVPDQFLDDDGLTHTGAAEQPDLAALGERRQQVDHLDAGLQDLPGGALLRDGRRRTVNRVVLVGLHRPQFVDRLAEHIQQAGPGYFLPTGTVIGDLVSVARIPRRRPSVEDMATQRTVLLPRCCMDSRVKSIFWVRVALISSSWSSLVILMALKKIREHAGSKLDVYYRADNLNDMAIIFALHRSPYLLTTIYPFSASAPPTISESSLVIAACRALLNDRVKWSIISTAFSEAAPMAIMRAACSLALDSSRAL